MELGEKLLRCRQEAGLSQRQLCEGIITRNMLSLIEHGTARPSMDTLRTLAARLGKPVSWFLDEEIILSANQNLMRQAEDAYREKNYGEVLQLLEQYCPPDPLFDRQMEFLRACATLKEAETAASQGKALYARQLLESGHCREIPELERRRLLALSRLPGCDVVQIAAMLPDLDEELLLRAEASILAGNPEKAISLLNCAQNHALLRWKLLMGKTLMARQQYTAAADILQQAEAEDPISCAPLLEICFRELGDFQQAYLYACKQKT